MVIGVVKGLLEVGNRNTKKEKPYTPGSGILFENGVCATLTQTSGTDGSVTVTITGA